MTVFFQAIPTKNAEYLRNGGTDAYGHRPEILVSDGVGYPCRHCLATIEAGEEVLLVAYRPFPKLQPYAETGPIFLHARPCRRYVASEVLPPALASPQYIVRGYGADDRIKYRTGSVTPTPEIVRRARKLLARDDIAYVHVRSASNNCYQCRIDRADVVSEAEALAGDEVLAFDI